jgi:hypothetical protein
MTKPLRALIALSLFNAVSAIGGGIGLLTGALPVPTSLLELTPFDTYVVPGLFLAVVIGGSSLAGTITLLARTPRAGFISAGAGLVMVGWILGETVIVQGFSWLQGLYLMTGLLVALASWYLPVATSDPSAYPDLPSREAFEVLRVEPELQPQARRRGIGGWRDRDADHPEVPPLAAPAHQHVGTAPFSRQD